MQYRKLSELKKLENNPRTITPDDMNKLVASIKKFWVLEARPLILSNRTGELVVIGGNMRYEASKKLWIEEVPTELIENLSEEDEREIIIRDNVSNGEWDMERLQSEWSNNPLWEWWLDVDLRSTDEEKELIEDNVPEVQEIIYVQEWDKFQLWNHTVMCGNSMDESDIQKLLEWKNNDIKTHCISDPPYWISYTTEKHWMIKNDDVILDYTWLGKKYSNWFFCMWTWYQVLDKWMVLVKNSFEKITNLLIWSKGGGGMWDYARTLIQDYEVLIVSNRWNELQWYRWSSTWMWNQEEKDDFLKKATKDQMKEILLNLSKWTAVWKIQKDDTMTYLHPNQKPVEINQRVLENFTARWDNVLDLFWGSGSNLVACEKTWRKMWMMELDPKYVQVIIKRYKEYMWSEAEIVCVNRDIDINLF